MGIYLNESSNLHKIGLASKCKPHQDLAESAKKGEYPGYLNMIDHLKDLDDVNYIRQDMSITNNNIDKIIKRLDTCKDGETKENKSYYKGIKKMYIDKGVTKADLLSYKKWMNTVARDYLNKKAKELRSNLKESSVYTEDGKYFKTLGKKIAKTYVDAAKQAPLLNTKKEQEWLENKSKELEEELKSTNEVFGLSQKEKDRKNSLRELELEYDKKFNAFFLHVGGYPVDKLENVFHDKMGELRKVREEIKHASKEDKYALKIKEDYLINICNRCGQLIRKKKKLNRG